MNQNVPLWVSLLGSLGLGGVTVGLFAYLSTKRTTSGRIDTTEAAKLWDESNLMRKELRDEVVAMREKVGNQDGKLELLAQQNESLRVKNEDCLQREARLITRLDDLERSVERRRTSSD